MKQYYCNNIINVKKMLKIAQKNKYAIGHFNINNLIWAKALLLAAEETKTPIILGVSKRIVKYFGGYNVPSDMVSAMLHDFKITVPVALHLDHSQHYDEIHKAIHAGFSSVMMDGSHFTFEENYKITSEVVNLAKRHNVSVEAEVGAIGGKEDHIRSLGKLANPEEAIKMGSLGLSALAVGIGNIHGIYPSNWKGLSFELLKCVAKATDTPLVLHGGSGIPHAQIKKAIHYGICKVNVNTECQIAFSKATKDYYAKHKDQLERGYDPRKVLQPGFLAIQKVFKELVQVFGCYGKGDDFRNIKS